MASAPRSGGMYTAIPTSVVNTKWLRRALRSQKLAGVNAPFWRSLTISEVIKKPEMTKKYMFGTEVVSDWKVGSPLLWQANYEGKETVFVKGSIFSAMEG